MAGDFGVVLAGMFCRVSVKMHLRSTRWKSWPPMTRPADLFRTVTKCGADQMSSESRRVIF